MSPFEFRALEVALEAICSFLDARTTELETAAYPALDELTSKVSKDLHLYGPSFSVFKQIYQEATNPDTREGSVSLSHICSYNLLVCFGKLCRGC